MNSGVASAQYVEPRAAVTWRERNGQIWNKLILPFLSIPAVNLKDTCKRKPTQAICFFPWFVLSISPQCFFSLFLGCH